MVKYSDLIKKDTKSDKTNLKIAIGIIAIIVLTVLYGVLWGLGFFFSRSIYIAYGERINYKEMLIMNKKLGLGILVGAGSLIAIKKMLDAIDRQKEKSSKKNKCEMVKEANRIIQEYETRTISNFIKLLRSGKLSEEIYKILKETDIGAE